MSKKTRDIVIDADHILYRVTESNTYKDGFQDSYELNDSGKLDMTPYQEHFKAIVDDYITTAEVESICYKWSIGKIRVIMSDHTNFRYDIFSEYKKGRPKSPKLRRKLKKWAMKYYHFEPNCEADDVVAYYVRKGGIGFTEDKDLLYGVAGIWFNAHYKHKTWLRTNKKNAEFFFKQQALAGDSGDDIPSLDGIGLKTAEKLLHKFGDSWSDILSVFKDKTKIAAKKGKDRPTSYDKKYMVTMTRLVCMSQWTPKGGIQLWEFPK